MSALCAVLLAGLTADPLLPGAPFALKGHGDTITAVAFAPDGKTLFSGSRDKTVRQWLLSTGEQVASFTGATQQVSALSVSADGALLAVGDVGYEVRVLALPGGAEQRRLVHSELVVDAALAPDGKSLAIGGHGGGGVALALPEGKQLFALKARSVRFSPDGKTLYAGTRSGTIVLADAKTGKVKKELKTAPHQPWAVASADGKVIASWNGGERAVRLWSEKGKALGVLEVASPGDAPKDEHGHGGPTPGTITSIALSPDGKRLWAASTDQAVREWDVAKRAVLRSWPLQGVGFVAVSPDGAWLAVGDGTVVKLWRLDGPAK